MESNVMTNTEESLDMLTPGSNWFNSRNQKLVTALLITNAAGNLSPKFLEANPQQVVFLTDSGLVLSINVDKFLNNHTFYNVNSDAEKLIDALVSGVSLAALLGGESIEADTEELPDTETPVAGKITTEDVEVYRAKPSAPIEIQFLTVEGDTRNPPLLTSEDLQKSLLAVEQEPIIVERNGGLSHVGKRIALVFNNAPSFDAVVESVFDPASVTTNYAGFTLGGETYQIDAYLGTTVQHNRAGSSLIVHLAQLEDQEEDDAIVDLSDDEEDAPESTTEAELAPAEAPKDFAALAAQLAAQAPVAAAAVQAEVAPQVAPAGAAVTIS